MLVITLSQNQLHLLDLIPKLVIKQILSFMDLDFRFLLHVSLF